MVGGKLAPTTLNGVFLHHLRPGSSLFALEVSEVGWCSLVELGVCFVCTGGFPREVRRCEKLEEGVGGSITLIPLVAAALEGLDIDATNLKS